MTNNFNRHKFLGGSTFKQKVSSQCHYTINFVICDIDRILVMDPKENEIREKHVKKRNGTELVNVKHTVLRHFITYSLYISN